MVATLSGAGATQFTALAAGTYTVVLNYQASFNNDHSTLSLSVAAEPVAADYVYDALYRLKTVDRPGTANDEAFDYERWAIARAIRRAP